MHHYHHLLLLGVRKVRSATELFMATLTLSPSRRIGTSVVPDGMSLRLALENASGDSRKMRITHSRWFPKDVHNTSSGRDSGSWIFLVFLPKYKHLPEDQRQRQLTLHTGLEAHNLS